MLTPDQVEKLLLPLHLAIELLPLGLFTEEHARAIACFLSVAQMAAEEAGKTEVTEIGAEGALVIMAMRDRVRRGANWNVTAEERATLARCLVVMDRFFRTQSSARWLRAMDRVDAICEAARAEGAQELDVVPA